MVYVDGQGNIVRPRHGMPRIWTLCAAVAVAAVMVQTVPSLAELKDHRARADGLWLSPTVEWHASLGVASIAKCESIHLGAFGRWLSLSDLVPKQLRPRLEAVAADDSQLLLAIIAAVFIAHVLLPGWRFLRHFPASAEALRAGRYWSLVLAAFAHDDIMHVRCQCGKTRGENRGDGVDGHTGRLQRAGPLTRGARAPGSPQARPDDVLVFRVRSSVPLCLLGVVAVDAARASQ